MRGSGCWSDRWPAGDPRLARQRDRTRVRLNIVLYAVALLCVAAIGLLGSRIWGEVDDSDGFWDHVGDVVRDPEPETASQAGEKIGDARLEALPLASTEEQERTAAAIDAASKMANVFLNVRYDDVDAYAEAVRELATGDFREQFDKSTEGIEKVAQRAKSVQTGDVLWAGVVAVDEDSATVIVASSGTVANTTTKFKAGSPQLPAAAGPDAPGRPVAHPRPAVRALRRR